VVHTRSLRARVGLLCCGVLLWAGTACADWVRPSPRFIERFQQITAIHAEEAIARTTALNRCLEDLLAAVEPGGMERCRTAWLASHRSYIQGHFFARVAAHLPGATTRSDRAQIHFVDAWPIVEGYVDSLELYPASGIVSDLTVPITEASLLHQHGLTDRSEVAVGFHPLEFILWSRGSEAFLSQKTLTDDQLRDGMTTAELPRNRRREMVLLLAGMLEREISSRFTPLLDRERRNASAYATVVALSRACTEGWRHMQGEIRRYLSAGEEHHSRFSRSGRADLISEAEVLVSVVDVPGRFIDELVHLDTELAARYLQRLRSVSSIVAELDVRVQPETAAGLERLIGELIEESSSFDQHLSLARP